jgi:hypothetical protein
LSISADIALREHEHRSVLLLDAYREQRLREVHSEKLAIEEQLANLEAERSLRYIPMLPLIIAERSKRLTRR